MQKIGTAVMRVGGVAEFTLINSFRWSHLYEYRVMNHDKYI